MPIRLGVSPLLCHKLVLETPIDPRATDSPAGRPRPVESPRRHSSGLLMAEVPRFPQELAAV